MQEDYNVILIKPQLFYLESFLSVNFDFSQASVSVADLEDAGVAASPILANQMFTVHCNY